MAKTFRKKHPVKKFKHNTRKHRHSRRNKFSRGGGPVRGVFTTGKMSRAINAENNYKLALDKLKIRFTRSRQATADAAKEEAVESKKATGRPHYSDLNYYH